MSVIGKLWRGQYSLPIAFWVFYVVGYFGSVVLTWVVSPLFGTQPWRMLSVLAIVLPYNIVSAVGVLRNSESGWWPTLAKIAVCLWEARIAWSLVNGTLRGIKEWGL